MNVLNRQPRNLGQFDLVGIGPQSSAIAIAAPAVLTRAQAAFYFLLGFALSVVSVLMCTRLIDSRPLVQDTIQTTQHSTVSEARHQGPVYTI